MNLAEAIYSKVNVQTFNFKVFPILFKSQRLSTLVPLTLKQLP